ncbi:uncharacterized protein LOC131829023 isoform X1 [Mustela lutreola]|uniref:uncharacterized protein LOC131829022 isoform X1 n=1 Tax=Mustela lutreola TaxID=9666 RepID=UPI002797315D|nr:uncharacterized protein LOC131829022 isoform X1 [Mustela lutreola]XP_059026344.1 uncharacterized protein LOC131829023 isoform X1 [Mustela lutreola]
MVAPSWTTIGLVELGRGRTWSISRGGGGGGRGGRQRAGKDKYKDRGRQSPADAVLGTVTASRGERITQPGFRVLERIGGGQSRWATGDPPVPCGNQATKAREDSELGTHPTEGRAQHPQSSGSPAALTPLCPLSWPTPASSLISDPEKDSMDDDSVGRSHPAPLSRSFPSVDMAQMTREAEEEEDSGTGCATGQCARHPEAPKAPGVLRQREPGGPWGPTCGSDLGPEEDSA